MQEACIQLIHIDFSCFVLILDIWDLSFWKTPLGLEPDVSPTLYQSSHHKPA